MFFAFIGTQEVIIVLVIALLVFGPAKLPEFGRQIGGFMRELRKMSNDVQRALDIDDYRYDTRNDASYRADGGSTWTPDGDAPYASEAESATATATETESDASARPWSVQDLEEPEPAAHSVARSSSTNASSGGEESLGTLRSASEDITPVTTAEPPGPPSR